MSASLAIFSAPKPFTNPHINLIQRNAVQSWLQLGSDVEVYMIGEEDGLAETAAELGVRHLPQVERNASGTPLISSMFGLVRQASACPILACINTDILIGQSFLSSAKAAAASMEKFLLVGQRWDLDVTSPIDFTPSWETWLDGQIDERGKLHPRGGSDYFIFPRACFANIPDFAIGRAGWDNWMIYEGRRRGWPVVDATASIRIVHQSHDYSHLPNGQPHYRLPETAENVRLAGGARTIFNLWDADREMADGKTNAPRFEWKRFWRAVEVWPLVSLHSLALGQVFYAIFHPVRAYWDARAFLGKKLKRK
jgi:hypothetical protein